MMRDYIPAEYRRAPWVYATVLATVRGYAYMVRRRAEDEEDIAFSGISSAANASGGRRGRAVSRPTERKALILAERRIEDGKRIRAVEDALGRFSRTEGEIIIANIVFGRPLRRKGYPDDRTMRRKKRLFVYLVAENLRLI